MMTGLGIASTIPASAPTPASFDAGAWRTWVLASGSELRLPPPAAASEGELRWLKEFMTRRDEQAARQIRFWDAGAPPYRWIEMLSDRVRSGRLPVSPLSFRAYALLSVAMYDATAAAWDSKYAYKRPRPGDVDPTIRPLVRTPDTPSYPSEHAVVSAAAAEVLAYLFPNEAANFRDLADEAARSRLFAGVQYPSDVTAGLDLGRAVGRKVVESARMDRTDAPWTGAVPSGAGMWTGTNPGFVTAPQWRPWFLTSASEFRPAPPPAYDSPVRMAEIAELKNFTRTFNSNAAAYFWQTGEGVHTWFFSVAGQKMFETAADRNPPCAARAYALLAMAQFDAMIASNDGKYTYWTIRPAQQDTSLTTVFTTPNFPSYPSNHSVLSTARAEILAYLFPDDAAYFRMRGEEAGLSRLAAGIHFRSDHEAGSEMGRKIARKLIDLAERDGSSCNE